MSEESISYIWGQQVTGDKSVVIKPSELPALLIVNKAVLVAGNEATVSISISGNKYAIAKLRKDAKDQTTLDLNFWELSEEDEAESFEISVTPKAAKVDLTGYYKQEEEGYSYGDDDDDDDEEIENPYGPMTVEDVTDAEAEKALKADEKKKATKQKQQPKQKQQSPQAHKAAAVTTAAPAVETTTTQPKGKKAKKQNSNNNTPKQEEKKATAVTPAPAAAAAAAVATTETTTPVSVTPASATDATSESTTPTTPNPSGAEGGKKRKADTPKGTNNKKQKSASPAPSATTSGATTPTAGSVKCPDCSRDFKGEKALQAHAKVKHQK